MKKNKLWKIIWIVGIYAILTTILYLVVLYKVEWEHKDLNTYLYFYNCDNNLCTATTYQNNYYSKVLCEDDVCPYIKNVINDNLVLEKNNKSWIYNYINGHIIHDDYVNYKYLNNDIFVVTDETKKQGIINLNGEELIKTEYEYIDNYKYGLVSYKKNNLFGINAKDGTNLVDANFEDIILINDKIYAAMKDNVYHIYSYRDPSYISANKYNFLDSYGDVILVANNNKIDILTDDLTSTLLIKIDSYYEYTTGKERESLGIYSDGEYIYFNVYTSDSEYTLYKYNINDKKLV